MFALSLVLGLSVMATPVSANVTQPTVVVFDTDCACDPAAGYNITFNITASLTEGVHEICVEFPAGTIVPSSFATGDIKVGPDGGTMVSVFAGEITVVGQKVCFLVPAHLTAANNPIKVSFGTAADIGNPCTPGTDYTLKVNTTRDPDSTPVVSKKYTIKPQYTSYKFVLDFGPTYPGIAKDFIPPFKACGQNSTGQDFNTRFDQALMGGAGGWWEAFNLTFAVDVPGCNPPCVNATLWSEVISIPVGETLSIFVEGELFELTSANITKEVGEYGAEDLSWTGSWAVPLDPLLGYLPLTLPVEIHFSSPGTYEFCLYAECPEVTGCNPEDEEIIASKCFKAEVYQWKDAYKIPLYRKWNLISLPLVPLVDPQLRVDVLAAYAYKDEIISTWNYEYDATCAALPWVLDPLTMKDGKSYWIRIAYNTTAPAGTPLDGLWVWGTPKPVPPYSPSAYKVCDGWNMIGFTEMGSMLDSDYLWNLVYGAVYGWNADGGTPQTWKLVTPGNMNPGEGYWASFDLPTPGYVYPP